MDYKHHNSPAQARNTLDGLLSQRRVMRALQRQLRARWANGHGVLSEDVYQAEHKRLADEYSRVCQGIQWTRQYLDGAGAVPVRKAA